MEPFRVRLNCVDHYQCAPSVFDPALFGTHGSTQQRNSPTVPVIRVFGATQDGQKVCAHIHGALPYLYIEYKDKLEKSVVDSYISKLRASIDHALAVTYRRNEYDGKAIFVGHMTLVKAVPFFGYHVGWRYFLKIYMLNPQHMTRFADLLYEGAIMGQVLQPFEAHMQYIQQWLCDFNLYGCNYVDCKTVKFRGPVPDYLDVAHTKHRWHDRSIPPEWISDENAFPRQSHCTLEVDVCVQDILNRHEIQERNLHQNFVERFITLAPDEKLVHSLAGLWRDESRRRKLRMGLTDPSSSPFPPEVLISMSADPRNTDKGGWIHEDEYRAHVEKLVQDEKARSERSFVNYDNFIHPSPSEDQVQTAMQSVEDLFPEKLRKATQPFAFMDDDGQLREGLDPRNAIVDESNIPKFDGDEFPYESDEDVAREIAMTQRQNRDEIPEKERMKDFMENVDGHDVTSGDVDHMQESLRGSRNTTRPLRNGILARERASQGQITDLATDDLSRQRKRRKVDFQDDTIEIEDAIYDQDSLVDAMEYQGRSQSLLVPNGHPEEPNQSSQRSQNRIKSSSANTPTSSQMSQGSIRAYAADASGYTGFPVSKNLPSSQSSAEKPLSQQNSSKTPSLEKRKTPSGQRPEKSSTDSLQSAERHTSDPASSQSDAQPPQLLLQLAEKLGSTGQGNKCNTHLFNRLPPGHDEVSMSMLAEDRPPVVYQDAYYSDERDVPERAREYAGREFKLEGSTVPFLPDFDPTGSSAASCGMKQPVLVDIAKQEARFLVKRRKCRLRNWEFAEEPPSWSEVEDWLLRQENPDVMIQPSKSKVKTKVRKRRQTQKPSTLSQIEGPTQKDPHGFKFTQKQKSTSVKHEIQYMSTMSLEVHVNTRANFVPDPEQDEVACIFWCFKSDGDDQDIDHAPETRLGILVLSEDGNLARMIRKQEDVDVEWEETELDLINRIVDIVRDLDPDIITGFEVHNSSWGYLIERARIKFEYNLCDEFSRMKSQSHGRFGKLADRWGFEHTSTIRITGRHMINIWRAMRSELNLLQYTLENIVFHLLHKRIPHYPFRDLTEWYKSKTPGGLAKCIDYFLSRVQIDLDILEANELIPRTSEQARLIGIDFFSVFSRGSQFKVESFMFRISKPENFILVSPSRKQVGEQNALECIPLVMEPQSDFYNSPLLVLDFQSLYPSIMIAYNYCYSTCLGRVVSWRGRNKMGFTELKREERLLELVKDSINISPNGMMYVKPELRKSLLAKMLSEILETRVMVKSGMQVDKEDKTLQQLLNNRQLALKLLANVTYGYTSASFSGRMPCAEIADSIVQTARETLEKTIAFIHSVGKWGAEVVYGDTDSLFVYLKGRTKDEAFDIGEEIAKAVTDRNPRPVKLKFEKVYLPCVLLAKKRYVGFKYESRQQKEPEFDAKGIETVRRDGTPAEQKIEEKALKILFRSADLSQVKAYFQRECSKIMLGRVSIQDFCFAREVKLGHYADRGPPPPGALISTRRMLADPRTEPQYGERVPYVVITGAPGARLIDRCVAPETLLRDDAADGSAELDAEYYISKNLIPPLERIFNLVGANVRAWYDEMPKVQRVRELPMQPAQRQGQGHGGGQRRTLENYMRSSHCVVCRGKLPPAGASGLQRPPLCVACAKDGAGSLFALRSRMHEAQKKSAQLESVCRSCAGLAWGEEVRCDSKDCPVFYSRVRARAKARRTVEVLGGVAMALEEEDKSGRLEW